MTITIKQLEALADEFEFDLSEARQFLGHTKPKKCKDGKCQDGKCKDGKCQVSKSSHKKTPKTGYLLFLNEKAGPIGDKLRRAADDNKLGRGDVSSEVGKQWRALTDKSRENWNNKAK
jgi:hypothetical protein